MPASAPGRRTRAPSAAGPRDCGTSMARVESGGDHHASRRNLRGDGPATPPGRSCPGGEVGAPSSSSWPDGPWRGLTAPRAAGILIHRTPIHRLRRHDPSPLPAQPPRPGHPPRAPWPLPGVALDRREPESVPAPGFLQLLPARPRRRRATCPKGRADGRPARALDQLPACPTRPWMLWICPKSGKSRCLLPVEAAVLPLPVGDRTNEVYRSLPPSPTTSY